MLVVDNDGGIHNLFDLRDVLDFIEEKCGETVKVFLEDLINSKDTEICELNMIINNMQDEIDIMNSED